MFHAVPEFSFHHMVAQLQSIPRGRMAIVRIVMQRHPKAWEHAVSCRTSELAAHFTVM